MRDLRKSTQAALALTRLIRLLAAIFIMCGVLWVSIECLDWILNHSAIHLSHRIQETLVVLVSILIAAIIYFIVLLRTGSVTKEDLAHVPGFESKLQPFLEKLHLL